MLDRELGIVLKKSTTHQGRLCLIAESLGKAELTVRGHYLMLERVGPGTLVSFSPKRYRMQGWYTDELVIVAPPVIKTADDCYWLHHILELYYYFTVEGNPESSLFQGLAGRLAILSSGCIKRELVAAFNMLCVIDFLVQTGFYASPALEHYQRCFKNITAIGLPHSELDLTAQGTLFHIKHNELPALKRIITTCLQGHPQFAKFNTVSFVYSC